MIIIYPGMEEPCRLKLCNGFSIEIDYVKDGDFDSLIENYRGRVRRIRLYDDSHNLLSEMVEENPLGKKEEERIKIKLDLYNPNKK